MGYFGLPCLLELSISARGMVALITCVPAVYSIPSIRPRRELMSSIVVAKDSSGAFTSTAITGSIRMGDAFLAASLNAIEPANLNAISFESTS